MRFKTLKHKTLDGVFGQTIEVSPLLEAGGGRKEEVPATFGIAQCSIPTLQPITATMELMIQYWKEQQQFELLVELRDYDLVTVDMKIII